jgi:hypothetical protein
LRVNGGEDVEIPIETCGMLIGKDSEDNLNPSITSTTIKTRHWNHSNEHFAVMHTFPLSFDLIIAGVNKAGQQADYSVLVRSIQGICELILCCSVHPCLYFVLNAN